MENDQQLLTQFVERGSQTALAELVHRHMDLVYFAALRRTQGNSEAAADVAQQVFISLARHARKLAHHPALSAWLHTATRNTAFSLMKSESRRREHETAAANDPTRSTEAPTHWAALQPVIDEALDALSEPDRHAILLRFFQQASFRQVAAALHTTEDAARMRTERAIEKLRKHLQRSGIKSTAAALAVALGQHVASATPTSVAAAITAQACATAPAPLSLVSLLAMSKLTGPLISSLAAASLTAGAWVYFVPGVTASSLEQLRAEKQRLEAATGPAATPASIKAIAQAFESGTRTLVQRVREKQASQTGLAHTANGSAGGGANTDPTAHRNLGIATPRDAFLTFAWTNDTANVEALAAMIWIDADVRSEALATMAQQPTSLVAQYPTPEQFYAFITVAVCLQAPPPRADIVAQRFDSMQAQELPGGRLHYPNNYEFQKTEQGWKWVLPKSAVKAWLHVLNDSLLTAPDPR